MKERRLARRIFRGFVMPAMLGALGIAALLVSLWLEHRTEITLPTPRGAFAVGLAIYDWSNDVTLERWRPGPGTKRELLAWIRHPSAADSSGAVLSQK
jgi:hypothetical protein